MDLIYGRQIYYFDTPLFHARFAPGAPLPSHAT
jgi:hypothetical protein